jgi:hypothetical protein
MRSEYKDEQSSFFFDLCRLGLWLEEQGYEVTQMEAKRTPEMAAIYAAKGTGSKNSLHLDSLADDLVIRKNGDEVGEEDYRRVGDAWKSLNVKNRWGGDFKGTTAGDYSHFSRSYGGRA